MSGPVDLREFVAGFLAEADELLRAAKANLLTVDTAARRGEASPRPVRDLFRALHTIKGLAAMVGVDPVVDIAHAMETVLRAADRGGGRLSPAAVEQLLAGTAAIEQRVRALADRKPVPPAPPRLITALTELDPAAAQAAAPEAAAPELTLPPEVDSRLGASEREQLTRGVARGQAALCAVFVPTAARAAEGVNITSVRERVAEVAEIVKVLPLSAPRDESTPGGLKFALVLLTQASDEVIAAAASTTEITRLASPAAAPAAPEAAEPELSTESWIEEEEEGEHKRGGVVRVSVDRLDDAMERLSALIVTRFRFSRAITALQAEGVDVRGLRQIADEHARQVRDLRASILKLRMISTQELLEPIPLIVRGLRASTGKPVRLEMDAGRAELDKAVAERILPAIVHLVRNAVDHGLESPEARLRAGKPAEGTVTITCFERSSTQLELCVKDDGAGIDREAVARRAGRETPKSDAALLDLLALPGLSTRDTATKTSGRGLGVDIVKRVAEELGGELILSTERGAGTTFLLRVPLTVTIVDALAFACSAQTFVVPIAMVEEIIEVDAAKVVSGPAARASGLRAALVERRGQVMPIIGLESLFALPDAASAPAGLARKALVVRRHGEPFAFVVDRMLGQQEIVVRPLEDPLVKVSGVSGVTDLGDGKPTLVLDVLALASALGARRAEAAA